MIENRLNDVFWKKGNGRDFLEWANIAESDLKSDYNIRLFHEYDDEVDALVRDWMSGDDFKTIMNSLHHKTADENLPQAYLDFKSNSEVVPNWVDKDLILEGCKLSERSGLTGLLVLRNFALLSGYNFANLTKPLVATGSLEKGAVHRLYNTLNFWVDVSRSSKSGQKMRVDACIKTRLIHSASRLMIQKKQPDWDFERYGVPINYADMIATNIAFTVYYLYGLKKLSFEFSEMEEAGIFHVWKYVTYLLGVPVEMIPNDKKEALTFFHFWTKYQGQPDQNSLKLTESLLNENTPVTLLKLDIIKRNMGYIHKSIANLLIDDTIRENLKIPHVRFNNIVANALRLKNQLSHDKARQIEEGNEEQKSVLSDYKSKIT